MKKLLTAAFLVGAVVTVDGPVAHFLLGDAHLADAAVEVVFRAVGAVQLVGKVRAVDDSVANAVRLADVAHLGDATWTKVV
jgi:hypothetical protein